MNYFDFAHDDEAADSATVATPNAAYKRMARRWALPQILMQGTLAMRDAGRQYLPQYPKESDDRYQTRLRAHCPQQRAGDTTGTGAELHEYGCGRRIRHPYNSPL